MFDLIQKISNLCKQKQVNIQKELDISPIEFSALQVISTSDSFSVNQFAKLLKLSFSRTSRVIDRLVSKGFVKRSEDNSDRRVNKIKLTDKGNRIKDQIENQINSCDKLISSILSKEESGQLSFLLYKLINKMNQEEQK